MRGFRKRILVTEGDLMQLWFEVEQVRSDEKKAEFKQRFERMLLAAQLVNLQPVVKGGGHDH